MYKYTGINDINLHLLIKKYKKNYCTFSLRFTYFYKCSKKCSIYKIYVNI